MGSDMASSIAVEPILPAHRLKILNMITAAGVSLPERMIIASESILLILSLISFSDDFVVKQSCQQYRSGSFNRRETFCQNLPSSCSHFQAQ